MLVEGSVPLKDGGVYCTIGGRTAQTGVVTHVLIYGRLPDLDSQGRPTEFYSRRAHDTWYREAYYDAGLFVEEWDDEKARRGYCLYKMGCRGPVTCNACSMTRWNQGTSYPIQSGHGCIGCSENGFWDNSPFYDRLATFPGFGIESTADTIGAVVGIASVAGVAAHAISANIRNRKSIEDRINRSVNGRKAGEGEGGEV